MNKVFKALSDSTRRRILQLLANGDMTAGEIAKHFNCSKPTISHHLEILKSAGLVTNERHGQFIIYSSNISVMHDVIGWISELVDQRTGRTNQHEEEN
jgi:ArsR family transcriptional regulator, arsenate/arsenite/antimonite-responsive transcriptional repressor